MLIIIQSIAHDKLVRDLETNIIHIYLCHTLLRLVKQCTQL